MKWQKKLNKQDMKHLKETITGKPSLRALKNNLEHQKAKDITCWDCLRIAKKLKIEV
jgi:hypothetical protein